MSSRETYSVLELFSTLLHLVDATVRHTHIETLTDISGEMPYLRISPQESFKVMLSEFLDRDPSGLPQEGIIRTCLKVGSSTFEIFTERMTSISVRSKSETDGAGASRATVPQVWASAGQTLYIAVFHCLVCARSATPVLLSLRWNKLL